MKNGAYRYRYAPFLFYDHTPIGAGSFFRFYAFFFLPPITAAAVPAPQSTPREIQTVIWL